jgi:hypothetical protein
MSAIPGCWTRPTDADHLDRENMHGHIFSLNNDHQLTAYEYRKGPRPHMTTADTKFVAAVQEYLISHNLEGILGIEVLEGDSNKELQEFVLSERRGTVMLDARSTKVSGAYRVTGWAATMNKATDLLELKGGQSHAQTTKGTHQVSYDGKGLPEIPDDKEAGLKNALRMEGVIE